MKSTSVQKTRLWIKATAAWGVVFIQDRQSRADVLFIRAQLTIRADSFSFAQHRNSATTMGAV